MIPKPSAFVWTNLVPQALCGLLLAVAVAATLHADYSYTLIVDNSETMPHLRPQVGNSRALNDNGEVAFLRYTTPFFSAGIYKGSGGPLTTIATGTAGLPGFEPQYFSMPGINNAGTVVFNGGSFTDNSTLFGIFTGDGGSLAPRIANFDFLGNTDPTFRFLRSSINDSGVVAFNGQRFNFPDIPPNTTRTGYYLVVGTSAAVIAEDNGSPYTGSGLSSPAINSSGQIAFDMVTGSHQLLRYEPGSGNITTLLNLAPGLDELSLSDAGEAYFYDLFSAKVTDGVSTRTIADDSGPFAQFGPGMIGPDGDVAFNAYLDTNEFGIFTGPNAINDRVVAHGDRLFGDTVVNLELKGVNRHGQVAFQAMLQSSMGNQRSAVVVATRDAQPGDFNSDGQFNCLDVDALVAEIAVGGMSPQFDLTDDGLINLDDLDQWLSLAGTFNVGGPYLPGDANLDGVVDGQDFIIWNTNKFSNASAWCSGDFNADGVIDGQDFIAWNSHKFMESDAPQSVPEPGNAWLLFAALLGGSFTLRRLNQRGMLHTQEQWPIRMGDDVQRGFTEQTT